MHKLQRIFERQLRKLPSGVLAIHSARGSIARRKRTLSVGLRRHVLTDSVVLALVLAALEE